MPTNEDRQLARTYTFCALAFGVFLACSLVFMRHMLERSERESVQYLLDAAARSRIALERQIAGDFYTLRGVAVCVGAMESTDFDNLRPILRTINDDNAFIRMGLADVSGRADLVGLDGTTYPNVDLSGEEFFQRALAGEDVVSGMRPDPFSGGLISYTAVPVRRNGKVSGVLCAVNSEDIFRRLLISPVFDGQKISGIIGGGGRYVLPAAWSGQADQAPRLSLPPSDGLAGVIAAAAQWDGGDAFLHLNEEERRRLLEEMADGKGGVFTYVVDGEERIAVYEPTGVSDWFVLSSVPAKALRKHGNDLVVGATLIIAMALVFFLLLIGRIHTLARRDRDALERVAYCDTLTGYGNYPRFLRDADAWLKTGRERPLAVWYADIKKFKYLNDLLGYQVGDAILRHMAELVHDMAGSDALFCRTNADNFVGLRPFADREEMQRFFRALVERLNEHHAAQTRGIRLDVSMGVYVAEPGSDPLSVQDMMDRANMAQKSVKNRVGSGCVFYSEDMRRKVLDETAMEARMGQALEDGEFRLYFQPKVDIQNGDRIAGAEVLARWIDPRKGLIAPGAFIPLFEKNGFIMRLDRYMFEGMCRWLRGWLDAGRPTLNIAVNVSRLGLVQDDFLEYYVGTKQRYGIPDGVVELEFTETMILDDSALFRARVLELQKHGFLCSLDDFGAGYSSLNILKDLPIDVLKLDILFFRQGVDVRRERIVIANIVAMAHELNIRTIAEGVEEMEQVEFLRATGCELVQGYVFARPMPLTDFEALVLSGPALNKA